MLSPRSKEERIAWDDFFMITAIAAAQRSPDPNTQVGAVIVDDKNRIVSTGYNGFPRGIPVEDLPWDRQGDKIEDTKYSYVVHAEVNAILNTIYIPPNSTLYSTLFPCAECMKLLIQKEIKHIIYLDDKYTNTSSVIAARRMADITQVMYRCHVRTKQGNIALQKIISIIDICPEK